LSVKELLISEFLQILDFTELGIFEDVLDMLSVDILRVNKDVNIEMKFVLLEIKLPYQDSNKYKWLQYYI